MAKYEVRIQETSFYWYLVNAESEEDAKENWHEGDFVYSDWDMSEYDVIEIKEVKDA